MKKYFSNGHKEVLIEDVMKKIIMRQTWKWHKPLRPLRSLSQPIGIEYLCPRVDSEMEILNKECPVYDCGKCWSRCYPAKREECCWELCVVINFDFNRRGNPQPDYTAFMVGLYYDKERRNKDGKNIK